jgi:hypothetical protein
VRGKVAQFGRGAIGNVSQKILDQFARNLEAQVLGGEQDGGEPADAPRAQEESEQPEAATSRPAAAPAGGDSLDLLSVVGTPGLGKVLPAAVGLVLGLLIGHVLGAHRTSRIYREAVKLVADLRTQGP